MNKKKLLGILVGCLSVSLLAGCSLLNQGGTTSGNPSENSSNNSSNNSSGNDVILNGPIYLEDGTIIVLPDNCEIELEDTFDFQTAAAPGQSHPDRQIADCPLPYAHTAPVHPPACRAMC